MTTQTLNVSNNISPQRTANFGRLDLKYMMMIIINKILFYGTVNINFNSFVELGRISQTFAILFYSDINNNSASSRYQVNIEIWSQCLSIRG